MTRVKITEDEARAGINGYDMRDGTFFVLRVIEANEDNTIIQGLHIGPVGRGVSRIIALNKKVTSYTEAVDELKKEGY